MSYMIECRNLIKIYYNRTQKIKIAALRGIELKVRKGELVAIVGPSGAGKSTLLKIFGGLDFPSSGTVKVGGKLLNTITENELIQYHRSWIGFVWQDPLKNIVPSESAMGNVLLPMRIAGLIPSKEKKIRAQELLKAVGLLHRARHKPSQLSGGEVQRLGLAVALANDPKILLLDEPTGELDTETTEEIISLLKTLNEQFDKTMVVVTHDHRFEKKVDIVYRISDGLLLALEIAKDILNYDKQKEHLSYIDEFGLVRIPIPLLENYGIKNYVKIIPKEGSLEIVPAQKDSFDDDHINNRNEENKNES